MSLGKYCFHLVVWCLLIVNCVVTSQEFYQDGNGPENVGVYNLSKGVNRFCLSKPGNSSEMLV